MPSGTAHVQNPAGSPADTRHLPPALAGPCLSSERKRSEFAQHQSTLQPQRDGTSSNSLTTPPRDSADPTSSALFPQLPPADASPCLWTRVSSSERLPTNQGRPHPPQAQSRGRTAQNSAQRWAHLRRWIRKDAPQERHAGDTHRAREPAGKSGRAGDSLRSLTHLTKAFPSRPAGSPQTTSHGRGRPIPESPFAHRNSMFPRSLHLIPNGVQ